MWVKFILSLLLLLVTIVAASSETSIDAATLESLIRQPETPLEPQQVHIVFGADASEYVVSWVSFHTHTPQKSLVQYGTSPSHLNRMNSGQPYLWTDRNCGSRRMMHSVSIGGLQPREVVYYRVSSDASTWSKVFNFTVVDRDNRLKRELTVSLAGDIAVFPMTKYSSIEQWAHDTVNNVHDFVIHFGDIAYNLDDQCNRLGDFYMQEAESVGAYTSYVYGVGNHETDQNYTYATYLNRYSGHTRMAQASGSDVIRWFSFDAQLVHFVMFDTDAWRYDPVKHLAQPQLEWMRQDLAKVDRTKTPWIIVLGHRAMYCVKDTDEECNENAEDLRIGFELNNTKVDGVESLLLEFGVDLYMAGHTHHYMRTWPVKRATLDQKSYVNPRAPVHVQSGIGGVGGPDLFVLPMKPYDAWRDMDYRVSFSRLIIHNATHLSFTQRTATKGEVFDSFELVQSIHGPFA